MKNAVLFLAIFCFISCTEKNPTPTQTQTETQLPKKFPFHPEAQPGEVWYTNVATDLFMDGETIVTGIGSAEDNARRNLKNEANFKTARLGRVSYYTEGDTIKILKDYLPVFVQKTELLEAGIKIKE